MLCFEIIAEEEGIMRGFGEYPVRKTGELALDMGIAGHDLALRALLAEMRALNTLMGLAPAPATADPETRRQRDEAFEAAFDDVPV
ncbi:hypothetical protein [Pseudogemmobacter sonorensis]|uniref:hypothetical protein n=1 Tax=Pseudogemmobacter sonorensis TaxID=2989681 RepID=UPI0036C3422A